MFAYFKELYTGTRSLFVGMWITFRECFKPAVTVQYPMQHLPMTPRFRGHIELIRDDATGGPKCVACLLCQKACPSACIKIESAKIEGSKSRELTAYTLDFTKCSLCGLCVESCKYDALKFSSTYNAVSTRKEDFMYDLLQRVKEGTR